VKPELSHACGRIKAILNLPEDSPQMEELVKAARSADDVKDLPTWAQAAYNYARTLE
jgi:hypothetical protein